MRLKQTEIEHIKNSAKDCFGEGVKVYLFGSRVNDSKKGGDIDLYVETNISSEILQKKIKMLTLLEKKLGERKIDIVVNNFSKEKFIFDIARKEGIVL